MLAELGTVWAAAEADAAEAGYASAVIESNCLSKPTAATRRLSCQRQRDLHGLDPALTLFRRLQRLWIFDPASLPLLALLSALARDPRLAAPAVVSLASSTDLTRRSSTRSAATRLAPGRNRDISKSRHSRSGSGSRPPSRLASSSRRGWATPRRRTAWPSKRSGSVYSEWAATSSSSARLDPTGRGA